MWVYRSPIGKLYIKKMPDGQYGLYFNGDLCMASKDINAITNNVYVQSSGCTEWDCYDGNIDIPSHISEWEKV